MNTFSIRIFYNISVLLLVFTQRTASAQPAFLTTGLVAYYSFNGGGADETGHSFDVNVGQLVLGTDRFGRLNRAATFASDAQSGKQLFVASDDPRTVSCWFRIESYPSTTSSNWGPKPSAKMTPLPCGLFGCPGLGQDGEFFLDNGHGVAFYQFPTATSGGIWSLLLSPRLTLQDIFKWGKDSVEENLHWGLDGFRPGQFPTDQHYWQSCNEQQLC